MSKAADVRGRRAIVVQLDKTRTLRYDLNAFIALEEEFGDIDATLAQFEKGSMKALRALLWAGLLHEDENLTPQQVGSLVLMADIEATSKAMMEAVEHDMPEGSDLPGNLEPPVLGE